MMYVDVTALVEYSNGYRAVEHFTVPIEGFHRFERDVKIKSAGEISVIEMLKVEPCEN